MSDAFWIFGYGSLMWRPGFEAAERQAATLWGWHRSMCILSTHYRGTPEQPGLVLGLDQGGCCRGIAFRAMPGQAEAVRDYLHERELVSDVYIPRFAPIRLDDGRRVPAYIFTAKRSHSQYAGHLPPERQRELIRQGQGHGGSSRDYLAATVENLKALGLSGGAMHRLLALVDG